MDVLDLIVVEVRLPPPEDVLQEVNGDVVCKHNQIRFVTQCFSTTCQCAVVDSSMRAPHQQVDSIKVNRPSKLTVRRQVTFAIAGQEVVALPLTLEFRCELLRRYLCIGDVARLLLLHVRIDLFHLNIL